jgi:hypothetical protein
MAAAGAAAAPAHPGQRSALAEDLLVALDPVALAERAGFPALDPWQREVLTSPAPRKLLACGRQVGKSSCVALLALHAALFEEESLVLLLSRGLRQSQELFRTVLRLYRALGRPVAPEAETLLRLTLETGSRVLALPGSEETNRGLAGVRLLVCDEAARIRDEDYYGLRPTLAVSGGALVVLSSPFGTRGWFWEAWERGEGWARWRVPATACPRISPAFLEEERRELGEWWFRQEYLAEFLDAETQPFSTESIARAFREEVDPWTL